MLVNLVQPAKALEAIEYERDDAPRLRSLAVAYWAMDRKSESDSSLADLTKQFADTRAYLITQVLAYRGGNAAAFMWLDRAYQHHEADVAWVGSDPLLGRLHRDPRFHSFLRKMKLPEL